MKPEEFKKRIAEIYRISREIGAAYQIDRCTPDGHLVGAIGQIAAKIAFGLEFGSEMEEHNCTWSDGKNRLDIQVRCSGRGSIALRKEPVHLIAIEVAENGRFTLLFNGPGHYAWSRIMHQKNPQKYISRNVLLEIQQLVADNERLLLVENIFY
jgi:hypothetical protein